MKIAHYDTYDYPSYWKGRDYEHESEIIALNKLLNLMPQVNSLADIGAGFGRLTPTYINKSKAVYLVEPSKNLLNIAEDNFSKGSSRKKVAFINSQIEEIGSHFKPKSLDAVLMVRVMHHMSDPKECVTKIWEILKDDGYLILEFANKIHGKAIFRSICSGDFTFSIDILPNDIRCIENKNKECIPFYNYHPELIKEVLGSANFNIIKTLSVSNVRNNLLKKHIPFKLLLNIEDLLQDRLSSLFFGPSIFVLAQKRG